MGCLLALPFLASCTSEKFERAMRPVGLYIERSTISTDFDPRVLSSDGEGLTLGIRYDLGMLWSPDPVDAASIVAALERFRPSMEQNVSVGQRVEQASAQDVVQPRVPKPGDPDFVGPPYADPLNPKEQDDGWPSEAKIAAIGTALAVALGAWHKTKGLPFTKKRRDKKAFRT